VTDAAALYRGVHHLLSRAKTAGWKITRIEPTGHWRVMHPAGDSFTVAPRPTFRALLIAEAHMARIERANPSPTAGRGPAQQRTEP
jgi:hypothetical protein